MDDLITANCHLRYITVYFTLCFAKKQVLRKLLTQQDCKKIRRNDIEMSPTEAVSIRQHPRQPGASQTFVKLVEALTSFGNMTKEDDSLDNPG